MVDVISLYYLYEQQDIIEIKWIYGHHNPADFMTKTKLSLALKTLINSNLMNMSTTEWVEWVNINKGVQALNNFRKNC